MTTVRAMIAQPMLPISALRLCSSQNIGLVMKKNIPQSIESMNLKTPASAS